MKSSLSQSPTHSVGKVDDSELGDDDGDNVDESVANDNGTADVDAIDGDDDDEAVSVDGSAEAAAAEDGKNGDAFVEGVSDLLKTAVTTTARAVTSADMP